MDACAIKTAVFAQRGTVETLALPRAQADRLAEATLGLDRLADAAALLPLLRTERT